MIHLKTKDKDNKERVYYNYPESVKELDVNTPVSNVSQIGYFPYNLYNKEPMHTPYYACDSRDPESLYIIGVDRINHPPHFSRFGRAPTFLGYSSGPQSNYFEDVSDNCRTNSSKEPSNMAPSHLYPQQNTQSHLFLSSGRKRELQGRNLN